MRRAYSDIANKGWASEILTKQKPEGYWASAKSLYRPKYFATNWMALILSDLGLARDNPQIRRTADLFFKDWLKAEEPNIFKDEVCIVGNTARFLTSFGYGHDRRVEKLFERLFDDQKEDGGWHCWESSKGSLDCWEALAAFAAVPKSERSRRMKRSIERGAEFYLERRLFMDGGPKYMPWFRLHYPVHYYYDILVGLDVLSRLGYGDDPRLKPALEILQRKQQKDGTWLLDRVHPDPKSYAWGKGNLKMKWKSFALDEPGKPSKWITLTALRVLKNTPIA